MPISLSPKTHQSTTRYVVALQGKDYKELPGTVIMPAGQSQVTVQIETIDDDVLFLPGDMVVASWPARIGTVSVDDGEFILLGQQVLTLTEPDFTITLTLNPTDRGNLEVEWKWKLSFKQATRMLQA